MTTAIDLCAGLGGWSTGAPRCGVVLDPFGGAGTTSLVSIQEGRRSIICEFNPEDAALASARIGLAWLDGAAQMDVFHDAKPAASIQTLSLAMSLSSAAAACILI